jgi:electron transfer flavoprotein beta subunit
VGPEMSEMLNIPFIAYVSKVEEIKDKYLRVARMVEDGHEVLETTLPAIITVAKEINVPRLPSLRGIMKSKSAAITMWGIKELGVDANAVGLAGSSTQVIKIFFSQRVSKAEVLTGDAAAQVDKLVEKLKEANLI